MNPDSNQQQILNIADKLGINNNDVLAVGLNFIQKILFSADRNHYEILGLGQGASTEAIRERYRYLIAMFHPDKCAVHYLDGELYAALINNAYNELKNPDSRKSYDESLIVRAKPDYQPGQAANDSVAQPGKQNGVTKKTSVIDIIFDAIPLFRDYPKITVWGLLGAGFLGMIYLSSMDSIEIESASSVAVKPTIEIRETKQLNEIELSQVSEFDKEELAVEYLEQSVNSDKLAEILNDKVVSKEAGIDEAQQVKLLEEKVPGYESGINDEQQGSGFAEALNDGFDGGVPGTPSHIRDIMEEGGGMGTQLLVETFIISPELMMMEFVQSYEAGDIDKFTQLFIDDVKTNQGRGKKQLVTQFSSLFDATTLRKIKIKQLRVEPRSRAEALLISEIEAAVKHASEPDIRYFNGELVFRLVANDSSMLIAEIAHNVH